MAKKKKDPEKKWITCTTKKILFEDIVSGFIPDEMHWEEAYDRREEYKVTTKRLFKGRLDRLRADIRKKQAFAASDSAALANDRLLHPVPTHNHRGEPRWEGSEAQRLLRQDIDLGNHLDLMPRDLFMSEPDYYDNYPLEVFRKHIEQEVKLRKFLHQYK